MSKSGSRFRSFFGRTRNRALVVCGVVASGTALVVAPVIAESLSEGPQPPRGLEFGGVMKTVPATAAQAAGSSLPVVPGATVSARKTRAKKQKKKPWQRKLRYSSRITSDPITSGVNEGTYVGIRCPAGMKAISGGVLSGAINVWISSSAPNNPKTNKYTPGIWWVSATNSNIDGTNNPVSWYGVVNCLGPLNRS